jgi:hypothetical protein
LAGRDKEKGGWVRGKGEGGKAGEITQTHVNKGTELEEKADSYG